MLQGSQVLQGRYQLQESLGQNAGRQTWLATDVQASPPERVIVKLLAFSPQMQWEDFKLFEREAQVLKNLNHPRIPRYRDYFSLDKQAGSGLWWFALVQDYIPGTSLQQLLDEGRRFTELQVRSLATQILEILTYLHQLNPPVLHRDIKPSNLILGEDRQVYLVDFGAVQEQAAVEGVTFTVVGTAGYAPLEQFWGKAVPASDLYSLGATLIHILTGIAPVDLPQKNLKVQFSDRVSVNPNFVRWIEALTAPDLAQRYHNAEQALEDLKCDRYLNAPLQRIPQPHGSRVKLWKSPTLLKIEIPGRGLRLFTDIIALGFKLFLAGSSVISLFLVLVLFAILIVALFSAYYGFIFFHPIFALFFAFLLFPILMFLNRFSSILGNELSRVPKDLLNPLVLELENYSINFDDKNFSIDKRLWGWSYFRQRGQVAKIKNVKFIHSNEVILETELFNYSFGQGLTKTERKWIAQEIKDWLEF